MFSKWFLALFVVTVFSVHVPLIKWVSAQSPPSAGPLISRFGKVYDVPKAVPLTDKHEVYRVVFDVSYSPSDIEQVNASIETLARFLNMHVRAGIPAENLRLALVLHGAAAKDSLSHDAYRARFGVDNPNLELLEALADAGVQAYLCGQTANNQGIENCDLTRPVKMALSAMTALVALQKSGYSLIPW